jgi:ABC-type nitrate/sulfonate/bicarbonate transport system substrate-binding protein
MRSMIVITAIASLAVGSALAQSGAQQPAQPPAATQTKPATPSTQSTPSTSAAAMTEAQAKARFEAQGYGNVSQVRKDAQGMWTANAMKDGKSHQLSLDARGQVTQRN